MITAWKARHRSVSGHQGSYDMREIANSLLYRSRTGCQWGYLPHDLPPVGAVKYYFCKWRDDGTDQTIHDLLRRQARDRVVAGTKPGTVKVKGKSVSGLWTIEVLSLPAGLRWPTSTTCY